MKNKKQIFAILFSVLIPVFLVSAVVYATTTIGDSITIGADLTVTGNDITFGNGGQIDNPDAELILVTETLFSVDGKASVSGAFYVGGLSTFAAAASVSSGDLSVESGDFSVSGDATITGNDIVFGNGESISNASNGTIAFGSANLTNTGNITVTSGYINSPNYQVGAGATFTLATNTPTQTTLEQASYWAVSTGANVVDVAIPAMAQVDVGRHLLFSIITGGTNALTVSSGSGMVVVQVAATAAKTSAEDVGDAIDCLITTTATAVCTTYAND